MRQDWKSHLGTLALVIAAFSAVHLWQTRNAPQGVALDFRLPLLHNQVAVDRPKISADGLISFEEWRQAHPGQAVAIYIWADWCPICKTQESSVTNLVLDWPVLTVASQSAAPQKLGLTMVQRGLHWMTALDTRGDVGRLYGLGGVPAWIVVTPEGEISSVTMGYTTEWGVRLRLWWAQRK